MKLSDIKENLLTPRMVAERVGVTPETVRTWIESGKVAAIRVGGRWKIRESELNFPEQRVRPKTEDDFRRLRRAAEIATTRKNIEELLR